MSFFSGVVGYWMRKAQVANNKMFARHFSELDVTMLQFGILVIVGEQPRISQKTLAKMLSAEPSVLVKPLEQLESRGLIERERVAPDRRVQSVNLTAAGQQLTRQGFEASEVHEAELLRGIDADLEKALIKGLSRIVRNAEEAQDLASNSKPTNQIGD